MRPPAVMGDPHWLDLWQHLQGIATDGIRHFHRWSPRDGLPLGSPPPGHQHGVPTLVLGLAGTVRIAGTQTLTLGPGDLLLVEPGCWHEHEPHRPGSASFGLGFLAGRCDVLFFDAGATLWGSIHEQPCRDLMDRLLDCGGLPSARRSSEELPIVDALLSQVVQDRSTFVDWPHPGVLAMAAHLWNHLHEPISARDIIAQAGLGRSTAYTSFRAFFGRTPQQELLDQRLGLARHLLRQGFGVGDAAHRSGFVDRRELTRAFRRRFGHPPSQEIGGRNGPSP